MNSSNINQIVLIIDEVGYLVSYYGVSTFGEAKSGKASTE